MPGLHQPMPQPAAMERGPTEDSCFLTQASVWTRSLGLKALAKGAAASTTHGVKPQTSKPSTQNALAPQSLNFNNPQEAPWAFLSAQAQALPTRKRKAPILIFHR